MWPFSKQKQTNDKPTPTIKVGETLIKWDKRVDWWGFVIDGAYYSQMDNPVFDPQIINELPKVRQWIKDLDAEIDKEIAKQLDRWYIHELSISSHHFFDWYRQSSNAHVPHI